MSDQPGALSDKPVGPTPTGHLIFVGLPGAGKSSVGRMVAKTLGRSFMDFDREIERRTGKTVEQLFAEQGERAFRDREVGLTRELLAAPPMVWSPGGGWVTNPGVLTLVRPSSRIIHLLISPAAALERLTRSRIVRPLLKTADPRVTMDELWANRADLYAQADLVIDVEVVDSQQVVERIVALARNLTTGLG
ncbi:MAG: shikimate kinase [Gemmatimonadaceae bacterium]|nr:shikimate kinase [Gemmatimonadaceae bacterium]